MKLTLRDRVQIVILAYGMDVNPTEEDARHPAKA
jgi:hypothetical protein